MGKPRHARIPAATRSSVRSEVLAALVPYTHQGAQVPIRLGDLFLQVCARLERIGIVPARANGASYVSLRYSSGSVSFPDFGAPEDIACFVRGVLWDLYSQGVLAPAPETKCPADGDRGPPYSYLGLDCAVLTDHGQNILTDATNRIQVHDPDGYLANFRNAKPPPDPEMMRYLEECVAVFRGGHFLATVVLLGVASERLVEVVAESLRDALGDPEGTEWFKTYSNNWSIKARFETLRSKLAEEYARALRSENLDEPLQCVVTPTFHQIRIARNCIAHPEGREFTWNEVSGFLHSFVQYFIYANQIIALLEINPPRA